MMAFHLSEILEKENFYTIREMSFSSAHMFCFFLSHSGKILSPLSEHLF